MNIFRAKFGFTFLFVLLHWLKVEVVCTAQTPFEVKDYRAQPLSSLRSNATDREANAQFELATIPLKGNFFFDSSRMRN